VELLWRLSTLALRHLYTTSYPAADLSGLAPPTPVPAPGSPAEAARLHVTQARVAVERRAFVERAAEGLKAARAAEGTAADLTAEYRCVCPNGLYDSEEGCSRVLPVPPGQSLASVDPPHQTAARPPQESGERIPNRLGGGEFSRSVVSLSASR
jgi:hypothetical protein